MGAFLLWPVSQGAMGGRGGAVVFFFILLSGGWPSICQAPGSVLGKMDEDEEGWMRSEEFICPVILRAVLQLPETLCQLLFDCFFQLPVVTGMVTMGIKPHSIS